MLIPNPGLGLKPIFHQAFFGSHWGNVSQSFALGTFQIFFLSIKKRLFKKYLHANNTEPQMVLFLFFWIQNYIFKNYLHNHKTEPHMFFILLKNLY